MLVNNNGIITIKDAYFEHVDGTPLRQGINGQTGKGRLQKDENQTGTEQTWAFQIPSAPPYPNQQNLQVSNTAKPK